MMIEAVKNHVENKFGLKTQSMIEGKNLLIRVSGLDNLSLAKWIEKEFLHIEVTVHHTKDYEFSNEGWVKVKNTLE